ncbi:hypothetical protein NLJ89_g1348 [Agrocybe chaxingu]|uniref:Uncharacterized protein n=1 Tax=Agrocybe chaxingu TaxID=84603 RepID=A0A9W8TFC6_9AGAR|nr:hypothetical protein NLJ89_g1348 [Agrocybe chaxingu]
MNVVSRALKRSGTISVLVRSASQPAERTSIASPLRRAVAYSTSTNAPNARRLEDLFNSLHASQDVASIHRTCSALIELVKHRNTTSLPLPAPSSGDRQRILSSLHVLASSGLPEDLARICEMLRDLCPVLGLNPTTNIYSALLRTFVNQGHVQMAYEFLSKMPQLPGNRKASLEQIHFFLRSCSEIAPTEFVQDIATSIERLGPKPNNNTFAILIEAYWKTSVREGKVPTVEEFSSMIQQYTQQGMTFDPIIADALYRGYADLGQFHKGHELLEIYEAAAKPIGLKAIEPPPVVSTANIDIVGLLRDVRTYADMEDLAKKIGFKCTVKHYTIVLRTCVRNRDYSEAFHVYEQSKKAGIPPNSALIYPLLASFFHKDIEQSSDRAIERSLEIYQHISEAFPPSQVISDQNVDEQPGPDEGVYAILFRLLLSSPRTEVYLPTVESLLDDMQLRGLPTDTPSVAATSIIVEMRRIGSFQKAFEFYREHRSKLDETGFLAVLREYTRLSFAGDLEVPLITEYFSIVKDMRNQRIAITPPVYTVILYQIGLTAARLGPVHSFTRTHHAMLTRLVDTTRRIHDFLTLDASISPDAILWNQLMNTYQRLSCFADAYRLWEMMYLTGRYDQRTINIMLDACGYAGQVQIARSILSKLEKVDFQMDVRNWDTWVECLCRNAQFDAALKVVVVDMKKYRVKPTPATFDIFGRFARKYDCWERYKTQFQTLIPNTWDSLPLAIRDS